MLAFSDERVHEAGISVRKVIIELEGLSENFTVTSHDDIFRIFHRNKKS